MNATAVVTKAQAGLVFSGHLIKTIQRDGQPWISLTELGVALEYASPDKAMKQLFSARAEEFTSTMTRVFKVMTAGGKQAVRFFSLRGAHLIAMFARTDKAKAFRAWVLDILDREVTDLRAKATAKERVRSYHYPIDSARPTSKGLCSVLTPRMLIDPTNSAPEMALLDQLKADGHDVEGAHLRILAMRDGLTRFEALRAQVRRWQTAMESLGEGMGLLTREHGKPVMFGRAPRANDVLERHVYGDQLELVGGPQ